LNSLLKLPDYKLVVEVDAQGVLVIRNWLVTCKLCQFT